MIYVKRPDRVVRVYGFFLVHGVVHSPNPSEKQLVARLVYMMYMVFVE